MIRLLEQHGSESERLCEQFGVHRLDVFGSAATGAFDPATSDLDLVVHLGEYDDNVHHRYLDLIAALEDLLGLDVHMVTEASISNPYFRASVDEQREKLYAARDRQTAA